MVVVEKGNVVLEIKESEVQRYLDMGYNVTDGMGHILQECVPTDLGALKLAYSKHTQEIKELKETIAELQQKLADVDSKKPATKRTKKSDATVEE